MKSKVFRKKNIAVIYNGVEITEYRRDECNQKDLKREMELSESTLIGSVGNIRKPKNYPLAVEVVRELHTRGFQVHYLIAGQGSSEQLKPITELVEKYNLQDYVHILGFYKDIKKILSSLDVFLMTSSSEGHPLAMSQAMINGVPVVSTASGVEEFIEAGKEAVIVFEHEADKMADAIECLLNDQNKRVLLRDSAYQKASEKYSTDTMIKQYLELYENG